MSFPVPRTYRASRVKTPPRKRSDRPSYARDAAGFEVPTGVHADPGAEHRGQAVRRKTEVGDRGVVRDFADLLAGLHLELPHADRRGAWKSPPWPRSSGKSHVPGGGRVTAAGAAHLQRTAWLYFLCTVARFHVPAARCSRRCRTQGERCPSGSARARSRTDSSCPAKKIRLAGGQVPKFDRLVVGGGQPPQAAGATATRLRGRLGVPLQPVESLPSAAFTPARAVRPAGDDGT